MKGDTCLDFETLEDYLSGSLDADAARDIEQHVGQCSACSILLGEVGKDREVLGQLERLPRAPGLEPPALPESVGPYTVERVLGSGGMGVVYLAEQDNPRRHVALKVIRGDYNDPRQVRRFQREVETLARLQHPSIASIFDAGCTASGQHYFAMERVDGMPLDQSLVGRQWRLEEKLEVFGQVCDAVEYAHQHGVIHRDLKPANVMVDGEGKPKVLDFGLAQLADSDTALTTIDSRMARIQGTLPYMSPEQARGCSDEVAAASDVYALGVILYEMLAGRRPHELDRVPPPEAVRVICEDTPRPPSTYAPALPQDLDTIVLKAMEKEPSRRYPNARELADDVRRCLGGEAILARRPSATYRLKKLITKNRLPAALIAVMIVLALSSVIWQGILRARSEHDSLRAQHRSEFIEGVMESLNPWSGGRTLPVSEVLGHALEDIEVQFADDPEGEAKLRRAVAKTLQGTGHVPEAREQMERVLLIYRDLESEGDELLSECMLTVGRLRRLTGDLVAAEAILLELLEWATDQAPESIQLADARDGLAALRLAQGRFDEALAEAEQGLALRQRIAGDDGPVAASAATRLGQIYRALGHVEKAAELFQQVFDVSKAERGLSHLQTTSAMLQLGVSLADTADFDRSETMLRQCLDLTRDLVGTGHVATVKTLGSLGTVLVQRGEFDEAERLLSEACGWLDDRPMSQYPWATLFHSNYACLAAERGNLEQAETLVKKVIAQRRDSQHDHSLAKSLNNLGSYLIKAGRYQEAAAVLEESHRIFEHLGAGDQPHSRACRTNLAAILALRGRSAEAELLFRGLLASAEKSLTIDHPNVSVLRLNLSRTLRDQWRSDEARSASARALADLQKLPGKPHPRVINALNSLAVALLQLGDFAAAAEHLEQAHRIAVEVLPADHVLLQKTRQNQATAWFHLGQVERAQRQTAALVALRRQQTRALDLADSLELQARINAHQQDFDAAERTFAEAAGLRRSELVAGHWSVALLESLRGECLTALQRYEEARPCLVESQARLGATFGPGHRLSREARSRRERLDEAENPPR